MREKFNECLKSFGLTGIEATIYETLLEKGQMTGYEISKETGISRSNVYGSLNSLVDKGAAYVAEGEATKYIPVEVEDFTRNCLRDLQKKAEEIKKLAPKPVEKEDGYITVTGERHVADKIREMLNKTELRVYIMAEDVLLNEYKEELERLIKEKKKVVILSRDTKLSGAVNYETEPEANQIRLITDSKYVLTGSSETCLYSGQANLVTVVKEALKNRISLIELNKEDIE